MNIDYDASGKESGWLKVLSFSHSAKPSKGKSIESYWNCVCKCGNKCIKQRSYIFRKNKTANCGCIRSKKSEERFHSLYEKSDGCWLWKGSLNAGGYGKWVSNPASRHAYKLAYGEIPKGMQVCHRCDCRACVRPDHLFLGTIRDNQLDKVSKNRQAKGSKIGNSVLTEDLVLEIRKMRISGKEYQEIADHFSIGWEFVGKICRNEQWKHVALGEESRKVKQIRRTPIGSKCGMSKLTEEIVREIKIRISKGERKIKIAEEFKVAKETIFDIGSGRSWTHVSV